MSDPGGAGLLGALCFGTVSAFDAARGLGEVHVPGAGTWSFHSTAIADGSRVIDVGAPVAFRVVPGHLGRMEAREVTKLDGRLNRRPARS